MKKKNLKKLLLAVCCAALLVCVSIGATVAYLTSKDEVKNTFTVGKVAIELDEAKLDADGKALTGEAAARVKANSYKLMPNHEYTKDPTVTVKAGSEESYVRMLVTVTFDKVLTDAQLATKLDDIIIGYDAAEWLRNAKTANTETKDGKTYTVITYEYRYKETVSALTADNKLPALFTGIKVPSDWTNKTLEDLGGFEIDIVAEAIQADGFKTADLAWAAFNG